MSDLKAKLSEAMKSAMKSQDKERLGYARNLHAAVRKKEIDEKIDLSDDDFIKIVSTSVKQRKDSIEQFKQGGRDDLVKAEESELSFLQEFLPEQLSEAEVKDLIAKAVAETGASGPKDMGAVMKVLVPQVQGKADNKLVSQLVRESLNS